MSLLMDPRTLHKLSTLLGAACPSGNKVKVQEWICRREPSPASVASSSSVASRWWCLEKPLSKKTFRRKGAGCAARLSKSVGCLLLGHVWWYRRRQKYFLFLRLASRPCRCSSQRSLHNAPIFRLLRKVAVNGTHQCDFQNFCGASGLQL